MISSSSPDFEGSGQILRLNTFDEAKRLSLRLKPDSTYNDDLQFLIEAGSPTVTGVGPFQISRRQVDLVVDEWKSAAMVEFQDENGDGRIILEKTDAAGHMRVTIELGGPWSDQVRVSFVTDQTATTSFMEDIDRLARR